MRKRTIFLCILLLFGGIKYAKSQACCSGGVPISSNLGLASKGIGALQFQLTYDYNTLRDLLAGRTKLQDRSRIRNTHSLLLESSYEFSSAFSISALVSYVRQERIIHTQLGTDDITINQGLGDAIVLFRYTLFSNKPELPFSVIVGAGPKIPLGNADHTDKRGIILPADLQPGTGAWDGIAWGYFVFQPSSFPNLTFSTNTTYRITTPNQRFNGQQAYRFGNEFQVQSGVSYRFLIQSLILDPMLIFQYRTVSADQVNALVLDNTGGHWIYARTGININLSPKNAVRLMADFPLYRDLVGTQLSTSFRASISFYHSLSLSKKKPFPIN
ncbi:MAG: hypothetical protein AAF587_21900 [Bacteroidota bacterium]